MEHNIHSATLSIIIIIIVTVVFMVELVRSSSHWLLCQHNKPRQQHRGVRKRIRMAKKNASIPIEISMTCSSNKLRRTGHHPFSKEYCSSVAYHTILLQNFQKMRLAFLGYIVNIASLVNLTISVSCFARYSARPRLLNPWVEWLEMLFDELTISNLFFILGHMLYYEGLLQGLQKVF
jgi:hypothetical protein